VLDRARFPREKPCSEYLSPESTRVLERLGPDVLAAVAGAAPAHLTGMKVVAPSGAGVVGRFESFSYALPRTRFDTILRAAAEAAGAEVREGVKVEELVYQNGAVAGVVARETRSGKRETYRARVVVGADGLRSIVARRLGPVWRSAPYRIAFTAHVAGVRDVHDLGEMHVGRPGAGYIGLGPIGGGVTTVALVLPLSEARRGERFFEELNHFPSVRERFDARQIVRRVLATGPFARWSCRPVANGGGALLVGDAADFFDPFTGQGIYSALRGAELAAAAILESLASGGGASLQGYARARRREFMGKWILERMIGVAVGWPALIERVVSRLRRRPHLADLLVRATGNCIPARAVLTPRVIAGLVL
jgi:flavin-dependent dehydrogenase